MKSKIRQTISGVLADVALFAIAAAFVLIIVCVAALFGHMTYQIVVRGCYAPCVEEPR